MPAHQDHKLSAMRIALFVTTGTINDLEVAFVDSIQTAPQVAVTANEAWMEFFDEALIAPGHWNDRAAAWLATKLHTGNLTDAWDSYWKSIDV